MEDFKTFLDGAHERGLQVIIELVVNHTSDQHPWFLAARQAPSGSPERDFYVWSDTEEKYKDARIIFTDTEKSNWTWDPVAKAYFWHRFFSHQPDLNFDNPAVIEEILKVMRYWLDLGVDGIRLDAIPYLVERDGTNCENLPETHAVIRRIRNEMDAKYDCRMILAEANQWPTDVRPYFGDGDECHMAFHFPLMPRIFMGCRLEDRCRSRISWPKRPRSRRTCQWGLFLRNHDELTLEMVSADERDYMYLAYSSDPRMRINIGIRRRLAPLMDNNRRRIELLASLLFSFPGTPIMYYGDEIGMGDNIYLGDRNGVTNSDAMERRSQWRLLPRQPCEAIQPLVMDPVYGYEAANVEAEQSDSSSLLNWMRNMIALRKLFQVFGRGSLEFLSPSNRKVLAYLRRSENQQVLCVANLSRFAQPLELDLSALAGMKPVEMLGYVEFPTIGRAPYSLSLGPYGFMWFELQQAPEPISVVEPARQELALSVPSDGWGTIFTGQYSELETQVMRDFLLKQPWFTKTESPIETVSTVDWVELEDAQSALVLAEVRFASSETRTYFLPLAMTFGEAATRLRNEAPNAVLCPIITDDREGVLHDGMCADKPWARLLACIENGLDLPTHGGLIRGAPGRVFAELRGEAAPAPPVHDCAAQIPSTIAFGDRLTLQVLRRVEEGPNPETELSKYLTERAHFDRTPPFAGSIDYVRNGSEPAVIGLVQGLVATEIDGSIWLKEELERYFERCGPVPFPADLDIWNNSRFELYEKDSPPLAREHFGLALDATALLGRRTGEMHSALAAARDDPAFEPEPMGPEYSAEMTQQMERDVVVAFEALRMSLTKLPDKVVEEAALALSRRGHVLNELRTFGRMEMTAMLTRVHGDYHIGQVMRTKNDWIILESTYHSVSRAERRRKRSPLEDVAAMLRSLSKVVFLTLVNYTARRPDDFDKLAPWARLAEQTSTAEFLRTYLAVIGKSGVVSSEPDAFRALLRTHLLHKALHDMKDALSGHEASVRIALWAVLSLSE